MVFSSQKDVSLPALRFVKRLASQQYRLVAGQITDDRYDVGISLHIIQHFAICREVSVRLQ